VLKVKERLTGAIILVALIVLLVPELLSGPVRSAPRAAAVASSSEEPPLRTYTINLADDGHSHAAVPQTSGPQPPAPPGAAAPAAEPVATPTATPASGQTPPDSTPGLSGTLPPAATAAGTATPPAAAGAFMVQLGLFASRTNAERLARQVHAQGFQVSVSQSSSGRHLYQVRVGPAHDRAAANELAQHLRSAGHRGSVVPQP